MTKLTTQKSVVGSALSLLAPDLAAENAYGFQYKHGVILPAAVVGGQSLRLLCYIPAILDHTTPEVSFEYEFADYYTAPRIEVPQPSQCLRDVQDQLLVSKASQHGLIDCSFAIHRDTDSKSASRILHLRMSYANGKCSSVDVGQISRGWRYSYKASSQSSKPVSSTAVVTIHAAADFSPTLVLMASSPTNKGVYTSYNAAINSSFWHVWERSILITSSYLIKVQRWRIRKVWDSLYLANRDLFFRLSNRMRQTVVISSFLRFLLLSPFPPFCYIRVHALAKSRIALYQIQCFVLDRARKDKKQAGFSNVIWAGK